MKQWMDAMIVRFHNYIRCKYVIIQLISMIYINMLETLNIGKFHSIFKKKIPAQGKSEIFKKMILIHYYWIK